MPRPTNPPRSRCGRSRKERSGNACQKVGEAEALVRGGVKDILVSNQVVGARKLRRLAALRRMRRSRCASTAAEQVDAASRIAQDFGVEFGGLVEIEVGMERCGVAPGKRGRRARAAASRMRRT